MAVNPPFWTATSGLHGSRRRCGPTAPGTRSPSLLSMNEPLPRLLARVPAKHHKNVGCALLGLAAACFFVATLLVVEFTRAREVSGPRWMQRALQIPLEERLPYLIGALILGAAAISCAVGAIPLLVGHARRTEEESLPEPPANTSSAFVLARALRRSAARRWPERFESGQEKARRLHELTLAGRAEAAWARGDQFFSVELEANADLAHHLNQIHAAGWHQRNVIQRHVRTTEGFRFYGVHGVTRESIAYRTYLFQREPRT